MKQLKLLLLGAVSALLMLFVVFIPMRANAATIENGVPNTLLREGKAIYKFTLEDDSLLTINWVKNNRDLAEVYIYSDRSKSYTVDWYDLYDPSGKVMLALKRGTYYVEMFDGNSTYAPTAKVKFSWTSAEKYSKDNYSISTAKALKANTMETAVQIRKYNYKRWYKITLKNPQRIVLECNEYSNSLYYLTILDSKLQSVYKNNVNWDCSVTNKLPKGTYYVILPEKSNALNTYFGDYYAFKWR